MIRNILPSLSTALLLVLAACNSQTSSAPPVQNHPSQADASMKTGPSNDANAATNAGAPDAPHRSPRSPGVEVTLQRFEARHERKLMGMDADGDGRISRAEFLAGAKAAKGDPVKRFAKFNADGDGFIDKAEIEARLAHRFHRLDANGDGVLSPDERAAAKHRVKEGAPTQPDDAADDAQP